MSQEEAFRRLDELGVDGFLEMVAKGRLPIEIAVQYQVPALYLKRWVDTYIEPAVLEQAFKEAAQAFVLKSVLPLTVTYDSPGHAAVARALSERMAWIASKLDPDRWGDKANKGASRVPVQLVFKGVGNIESLNIVANGEEPEKVSSDKPEKVLELIKSKDYVVDE